MRDADPQKEDGALTAREASVAGYGTQGVFGVQFVHKETIPLNDRYTGVCFENVQVHHIGLLISSESLINVSGERFT